MSLSLHVYVSVLRVGACVWCEAVSAHMSWVASHGTGTLHSQEGVSLSHWRATKRSRSCPDLVSLVSHHLFPQLNFTEEKTSPFLREVQVNLIDFKKCNDFLVYDSYLTPRMMCAGDLRGGRDSCQVRLHLGGAQVLGAGG